MTSGLDHPFDATTLEALRARRSAKWRVFGEAILPAWVAEMDYPIAEPIRRALHAAIERDDLGYAAAGDLPEIFAAWSKRVFGWAPPPSDVHLVADVVTAIGEILRVATAPGDGVVIDPPVYAPFAGTIRANGRKVVEAPIARTKDGFSLDLGAIERAYRQGAKLHLLCTPHNPTGIVHPREILAEVGRLAANHGVLVLADEIHAPLTLPGKAHVPFPLAAPEATDFTIVVTSASKTWNLAGLKTAFMIPCGPAPRAVLAKLPPETPYHAGHFGVLATRAALTEGEPWRAQVLAILDRNRTLLDDLLAQSLPAVGYVAPEASYLAWLDFRTLGLGDDPSKTFLARGNVALSPGPMFGTGGAGFARLNIGTTRALLEEAVRRISLATSSAAAG